VLFYILFVLCRSLYCLCVYMCTELLPPGGYPIAVKYIIYHNHGIYLSLCRSYTGRLQARWLIHVHPGLSPDKCVFPTNTLHLRNMCQPVKFTKVANYIRSHCNVTC
jgi:hypothetical protein